MKKCYVGVMDIYMNPDSLTMMDLLEVIYSSENSLKMPSLLFSGEYFQVDGLQQGTL